MNDELRLGELERMVERLKAGDETARDELIRNSWDRLRRLAKKMLGDFPAVRRWEETDDVFQRSTVRLWEALKVVTPENTRHYFNLAALQVRRELIDLSRNLNGPQGINTNQDSVDGAETGQAAGSDGTDTYDSNRLAVWTEFHESIDKLDEEDREVFQLIWYQGLRQNMVAELLGLSQKTVSRRWQSSRRRIYELLGGQLPG